MDDAVYADWKRKVEIREVRKRVEIRESYCSVGDNKLVPILGHVRFSRCHDGTRLTDLRPLSSNAGRPSRAKGRRCIRHASTGHQPAQ